MHSARSARDVSDLFVAALVEAYGPLAYAEIVLEGLPDGHYRVTRLCRHDQFEFVPDHGPFRTEGVPVHTTGLFSQIATGPQHVHFGLLDTLSAEDPLLAAFTEYKAYLAIPIYSAGKPEWIILFKTSVAELEAVPLDDLLLHTNLVGAMLNSMAVSNRLREAQDRIHLEVERIATISRALLPQSTPAIPGLEVAFKVTAFDRAGGDLIEFGGTPSGRWGLVVADASGHGPSAAVVAAIVSTILRTLPVTDAPDSLASVAEFLSFANRHLCEKRIEDSFVTAIIAVWDPNARTLTYSRAGHPPPLIRRARDNSVTPIEDGAGIPLGIFTDAPYSSAQITLQAGDLLLFYTDGIIETANPSRDLFGEDRLAQLLQSTNSAPQALTQIESALDAFAQGVPPSDDRTLLAVRVL